MRKLTLLFTALFLACFTFQVSAQTTILEEDFETGSLPMNWDLSANSPSVGFEFGTASSLSSDFFTIPPSNSTGIACSNDDRYDDNSAMANLADEDRLITPSMNFSQYGAVLMSFDYYQPGSWVPVGVVEVSTNNGGTWNEVMEVTQESDWANMILDLTLYNFASNVKLAFRHDDGGQWADGFAVDNVLVYEPLQDDAELTGIGLQDFVAAGNVDVSGIIKNVGGSTISSFTAEYSVDGGTAVSETFTGFTILSGGEVDFTFMTPATISTPGSYNIEITITQVNGNMDPNPNNNNGNGDVVVLSQIPISNVVFSDHSGAWCQFCPDGTSTMNNLLGAYPVEFIGVTVHNGDAMEISDGAALNSAFVSGYPSGSVDNAPTEAAGFEIASSSRSIWEDMFLERRDAVRPAKVSITSAGFDAATRTITATVKADFYGPVNGDLRFNMYVLEDGVTGTGNGYNQVNFYNTQSGHPFFGAGNPIIGFEHDHTLRAMLGGTWGLPGIIPSSVNDGDSYSYTFNHVLPADQDETKVKLVGIAQFHDASDNTKRTLINAEEIKLPLFAVGIDETNVTDGSFNVYPNPMTDRATIEFDLKAASQVSVRVMNMFGQLVANLKDGNLPAGTHAFEWDGTANGTPAASGFYMVEINVDGVSSTQKVSLTR